MTVDLTRKLKTLPRGPGIYLMLDRVGDLLYIGKARSLRQRVSSYFAPSREPHPRTDSLVSRVRDVDFIVTDSELEALILEQTMVKERKPRYNVQLKDDKRFPYVRLTLSHAFPRAEITRQLGDRSSRYYGPYTDVALLRQTLKMLRRAFPLRVCSDARLTRSDERECLDYFIGLCCAPCTRQSTEDDYAEIVRSLMRFLGGKGEDVVRDLQTQMQEASDAREYERGAVLRNRLRAVRSVLRRQKVEMPGGDDVDVIGLATGDDQALGLVLRVRGGKVIGKEERLLVGTRDRSATELLGLFTMQFYLGQDVVPGRVALPEPPAEEELLSAWLQNRQEAPVRIQVPKRGTLAGLVRIAARNAALSMEERRLGSGSQEPAPPELLELQQKLALPAPPMRIEAFDVSTVHGSDTVASVVVFVAGRPSKSLYRRFRIRRVEGTDDFASIQEAVDRRISRSLAEDRPLPDLLLIDGGAGQVSSAHGVLGKYDLGRLPLIGLAKRDERVVFPDARADLHLPRRSPGLRLLQQIRNEAHRSAVRYHRSLRRRRLTRSALDAIPGIGPARKAQLLNTFGSVAALRKADVESVARLPGIGRATAMKVLAALRKGRVRP